MSQDLSVPPPQVDENAPNDIPPQQEQEKIVKKLKKNKKIKKSFFDIDFTDDEAVSNAVLRMKNSIISKTSSERINILLMGPFGRGKSSLAGTLFTCLSDNNSIYIFNQVSSGKECSRQMIEERFPGSKLYICDTFGMTGSNYTISDFHCAIEGRFKDGFMDTSDNEQYRKYRNDNNSNDFKEGYIEDVSTIESLCHCIIYVTETGDYDGRDMIAKKECEKLTNVALWSKKSSVIPILTALTKIDQILIENKNENENENTDDDSDEEVDLSEFYDDKKYYELQKEIRKCAKKVTRSAPNRIFPIKNYTTEYYPDDRTNYLGLRLLDTAVQYALDFKQRLKQREFENNNNNNDNEHFITTDNY